MRMALGLQLALIGIHIMIRTHEQYIQAVRAIAVNRVDAAERETLNRVKLVYGLGSGTYRGRCARGQWQHERCADRTEPIVEIAATGEESVIQLAGTTLHELGHVLSPGGHHAAWKKACERLGLLNAQAAGQAYAEASFEPSVLASIVRLKGPTDGIPTASLLAPSGHARSCKVGQGAREGAGKT